MKIENYLTANLGHKSWLNPESFLFYLLILFLPTQFGKHFWPDFSFVSGLRIDYLSPTVYFTDILVGLLFGLFLVKKLLGGSMVRWLTKAIQPSGYVAIAVLLVIIIYSVLTGGFIKILYITLKVLEMGFIAYYTAKFMRSGLHFQNVILLFCAGIIFESSLAIAQFVNQGSIGGLLYFFGERTFSGSTPGIANAVLGGELILRPYGTLPHPNVLAGYLLIVMVLILFSMQSRNFKNVFSIKYLVLSIIPRLALILGSIVLFLTMSRVAILLWILILGYCFIKKVRLKAFIFSVFGTLVALLMSPLGARFTQITISDESFLQRKILIEKTLEMIQSSPLFGVGLGNFIPTLANISGPLTVSTYLQPVHNIFFLTAAETGLIGFGIFIWFLYKTYLRIKMQELRIRKMHYALLFVVLVTGLFDHYWLTLQQGQLLFVFVIGLSWSAFHKRD